MYLVSGFVTAIWIWDQNLNMRWILSKLHLKLEITNIDLVSLVSYIIFFLLILSFFSLIFSNSFDSFIFILLWHWHSRFILSFDNFLSISFICNHALFFSYFCLIFFSKISIKFIRIFFLFITFQKHNLDS